MAEHLRKLRRVGWVLVIVGALDIGFMIYCIANHMSYSSSLNIFAVVAGILLLRGSLATARIVTWFSAFMLSGFLLSALIIFPWMQPLDYWLLTFRKDPLAPLFSIALLVALLLFLLWVYRELRSPVVVEARVAAGHRGGIPRSAFATGSALAIWLGVMLQFTMKGESAERAARLAAEQYGADYKYFVSSINWAGNRVTARLTAYNEKESKEVAVEWNN